MLETIVKNHILFYAMGIVMAMGVLSHLVSYVTLKKMVKAAGTIARSNHRLMKLIKAKFEHASMISEKMQNVEAFVNKYIYEYKVFGIELHTWNSGWKKTGWLIGVLGALGAGSSFQRNGMNEAVFQYGVWAVLGVLLLFLMHVLGDEAYYMKVTKNYIVEYLENVCTHRYAKNEPEVKEVPQPEIEEMPSSQPERTEEKTLQDARIREILQEFLA